MALQKLSPQRLDTSTGIILTPANTPSGPTAGQIYYDSTDNQVQFYNGSDWGSMGGVEGITDNSDAVAMTIDSAEKIGIGITAPDSRIEVKDKIKVSSTTTNPLFDLDNQTTNGKNWRMQAESGDGAFTFKNATDNTTAYQINTSGQFLGLNVSGTITATGGTSSNWNTAYGWGDHSGAGYATSGGAITVSTINGTEIVTPIGYGPNLGVGVDTLNSITTGDNNVALG